jgi:hypothetical protein
MTQCCSTEILIWGPDGASQTSSRSTPWGRVHYVMKRSPEEKARGLHSAHHAQTQPLRRSALLAERPITVGIGELQPSGRGGGASPSRQDLTIKAAPCTTGAVTRRSRPGAGSGQLRASASTASWRKQRGAGSAGRNEHVPGTIRLNAPNSYTNNLVVTGTVNTSTGLNIGSKSSISFTTNRNVVKNGITFSCYDIDLTKYTKSITLDGYNIGLDHG